MESMERGMRDGISFGMHKFKILSNALSLVHLFF